MSRPVAARHLTSRTVNFGRTRKRRSSFPERGIPCGDGMKQTVESRHLRVIELTTSRATACGRGLGDRCVGKRLGRQRGRGQWVIGRPDSIKKVEGINMESVYNEGAIEDPEGRSLGARTRGKYKFVSQK